MRSNTDRKPSRLAPVLAALGTILVVFILVGTMLWAFLSAGGADTIAVGVMALYGVVGLAVDEGKGRRGRRPLRRVGDGPCAA